jgi:hypothetical protein
MCAHSSMLVSLVLALGCSGGDEEPRPEETDTDTDADTDTDSDTDTDTDTDTDSDTDTDVQATDVRVSVNDSVSTILEVDWTWPVASDAVWITYTFEDDEWWQTPVRVGDAGEHHEVLLGIPAETEVQLEIASDGYDSKAYTATTGSLPPKLPPADIVLFDELKASPDRWMLGSVDELPGAYDGPMWSFILDRKGRYVWYHKTPDRMLSMYVQPSPDDTHVMVDECALYAGGADPGFTELTLDHRFQDTTSVPDHTLGADWTADGTFLYAANDSGELLLKARAPDGTTDVIWNSTAWGEDVGYSTLYGWGTMPNTVVWDEKRSTVFWSMFTETQVVEISIPDGKIVRQFGSFGGSDFDPPESEVDYQHYVNWTPDGTIIASTHVLDAPGEQRTREYEVDGDTLTNIWTFGEDFDHYAQYGGEAWRLPNGNTMIGYGTDGTVVEVAPDLEIVWQVEFEGNPLVGHMTLLDDLYPLNEGPPAKP